MNIVMRNLFKEYNNKKSNRVNLPNGMEVSLQHESANFYEFIYPFISEADKEKIIKGEFLNEDIEHSKAIRRCLNYFKNMRKYDIGIVIITSDDLPMIIQNINDKFYVLNKEYQLVSNDNQQIIIILEEIKKYFDIFQNTISGNSFATVFHREGTSVILDNEEVFNTNEFTASDLHVLSDVTGELIDNLFVADLLERLINKDVSLEKKIRNNLASKFFASLEPSHIHKRYLFFEMPSINSYQELLDKVYELIKKDEECSILNLTFDLAHFIYVVLKEE